MDSLCNPITINTTPSQNQIHQNPTMRIKIKLKIPKLAHDHQSTSSSQVVASIDDLLIEILLHLPIKSLLQFKLVSRHWHSLITSPHFCLRYNPNPNPAIGLFLPHNHFNLTPSMFAAQTNSRVTTEFEYVPFTKNLANPPFKKLKFTEDPSGITIMQSCNGLMLCSSYQANYSTHKYYIYNPTINRFSTLPKLGGGSGVIGMTLAFEPTMSPHYKVVCIRRRELQFNSEEQQYQIEIYSSETGPWRECGGLFTTDANLDSGVYWNNAIHWISDEPSGDSLYFNLDHDQMHQTMPMPPIPDHWDWIGDFRSNYYFGESGGHLHYIELLGSRIQLNVYEMKRDYSEWFIKYVVNLAPVVEAYPGMIRDNFDPEDWYYYAYSIFCVVRGREEEDDVLVLQIPGKVIRYSLVEGSFETIYEFKGAAVKDSLEFPSTDGFQYIESLCCV